MKQRNEVNQIDLINEIVNLSLANLLKELQIMLTGKGQKISHEKISLINTGLSCFNMLVHRDPDYEHDDNPGETLKEKAREIILANSKES